MTRQSASGPGNPDRRLAPRPLPAHLLSATMLWQSCRAALASSNGGSPHLNAALDGTAAAIRAAGTEAVAAALDAEIAHRGMRYLEGLENYRRHPFRRRAPARPVIWREGTTRLIDYGTGRESRTVFVVPSLINRYYVLDLLEKRSFLSHLAGRGLRPLVVDWGSPGRSECDFTLDDYIAGRLARAFAAAAEAVRTPLGVVGYCMGGLLALAMALREQARVAALVLLATPWNFHAERAAQAQLFALIGDCLPLTCDAAGLVPIDVIQSLFFLVDPFLAQRKFIRFAALDPDGAEARSFVALEDWINDGVPLPLPVAQQCARGWYGENDPAHGHWHVAGHAVEPRHFRRPALVVLPRHDRIVPPLSAAPLAGGLPGAAMLRPPLGHVGMMSAGRAPSMLWTPIADWLEARLGGE
jgi:polyhydroxyalkanoate synthase